MSDKSREELYEHPAMLCKGYLYLGSARLAYVDVEVPAY